MLSLLVGTAIGESLQQRGWAHWYRVLSERESSGERFLLRAGSLLESSFSPEKMSKR